MPRLAGDDPGYRFRVVSGSGPDITEYGFVLPSVTEILNETLGKPSGAMAHWGYYLALNGMVEALGEDPVTYLAFTADEWKQELKDRGVAPTRVRDKAAVRGQAAHDVMEAVGLGDLGQATQLAEMEIEHEQTRYGQAVLRWWEDRRDDVIIAATERPVWSLDHGYAGTLDLVLDWSDEANGDYFEVADLKTHKPASGFTIEGKGAAYIGDVIQCAAYRQAWEEMNMGKIHGQRVIVARENGEYLEDTREVDARVFNALVEVYHAKARFEMRGGE